MNIFFFNDTATTEIYTLSLHDALPISVGPDDTVPRQSIVTVPGTLPPPAFEEADLFYRLRPAGGVGD